MKNFNIKSKKGFTLIELLVVIGILAVLAAIAIPSIAGLIDRANVSADNTNANEYTNTIERFASEYELYCQDIASGTLDIDNLDSAQGRVYNVISAVSRYDIETIEIDKNDSVGEYQVAIFRDTKYPANAYTAQLIVQNYAKTSSSSFEPKQSDMHYWYSPDCGIVVFAEPNADQDKENKLNSQIISGMDAKGNALNENTTWIDLTNDIINIDLSTVDPVLSNNSWETIYKVIKTGKISEVGWKIGDISPAFQINGKTVTATLIGINHDGNRTATFFITSSGGIGFHTMNANNNIGGWKSSDMRNWLNGTIFNSMSNNEYIKSVTKMTNNIGKSGNTVSSTHDKLFLLSPKEAGLHEKYLESEPSYIGADALRKEGNTYKWFADGGKIPETYWLRSPRSTYDLGFFYCESPYSDSHLKIDYCYNNHTICPAFVIG